MEEQSQEEYIIYIETDFGELKVEFTSEQMDSADDVLKKAIEILSESKDIQLTDVFLARRHFYDITQGYTKN